MGNTYFYIYFTKVSYFGMMFLQTSACSVMIHNEFLTIKLTEVKDMNIQVYTPDQQAVGEFDGGKITEQKPIGFPGEGSAVKRLGPLFYWAWMKSPVEGYIPPHPHQGFEIMTYMVSGKAGHGDSLGTRSVVEAGGIQLMQTGSGVYHEERIIGPDAEGFQIWFEPYLEKAFHEAPTYRQFEHNEFPIEENEGQRVKTIIGDGSVVDIVTDIKMWDVFVKSGGSYQFELPEGYALAVLAFRGDGEVEATAFHDKDFVVIQNDGQSTQTVHFQPKDHNELHLMVIQTPIAVDYPLYPHR
ncbi:pirin family protein [Brevibacillus ginsengisoli]|uniref:pirin family protein n=1 Tax=Brevibacillus ginsengisoli TaxID=363854 RepID=UPI003CF0E978